MDFCQALHQFIRLRRARLYCRFIALLIDSGTHPVSVQFIAAMDKLCHIDRMLLRLTDMCPSVDASKKKVLSDFEFEYRRRVTVDAWQSHLQRVAQEEGGLTPEALAKRRQLKAQEQRVSSCSLNVIVLVMK
jgi:hypothetical protein